MTDLSLSNIFIFLLAIVLFYLLTRAGILLFSRVGVTAKLRDTHSRWSNNPKPTIGGMVFMAGLLAATLTAIVLLDGDRRYALLLVCGAASFLLGLWDDIKRLSPSKKMAGQVLIAFSYVMFSVKFGGMSLESSETVLKSLLNIFIIVGLMNAVNMLDNLDAVSAISAIPALLWPLFMQSPDGLVTGIFLASVIAFLFFNWSPAKIYMGDSGSLLLGFVLAWIVIEVRPLNFYPEPVVGAFMLLVTITGNYLADSAVVVINRIRHGISPAVGGRDHTTHQLVYLGLKENHVAIVFMLMAAVEIPMMFIVVRIDSFDNLVMFGTPVVAYFFLIFAILFSFSVRNLRKGKFSYRK